MKRLVCGGWRMAAALAVLAGAMLAGGCASHNQPGGERYMPTLETKAIAAVAAGKEASPEVARLVSSAAGYVVFPEIGAGGALIGCAYGDGVVYENGKVIGYATVSQVTAGAILGGQTYTQFVFFQTPRDLEEFKKSKTTLVTEASLVVGDEGGSTKSDYSYGVAVVITGQEGLMANAAIGAQDFNFRPKAGEKK